MIIMLSILMLIVKIVLHGYFFVSWFELLMVDFNSK